MPQIFTGFTLLELPSEIDSDGYDKSDKSKEHTYSRVKHPREIDKIGITDTRNYYINSPHQPKISMGEEFEEMKYATHYHNGCSKDKGDAIISE